MAISKRQAVLNEQKGQEGEKIVGEAIERAIENLRQEREDMCFSIYDNYVFKTKSVISQKQKGIYHFPKLMEKISV